VVQFSGSTIVRCEKSAIGSGGICELKARVEELGKSVLLVPGFENLTNYRERVMSCRQVDDQTPKSLAIKIVQSIKWAKGESVLEPCRGDGAFFNALPQNVRKDWCEIRDGKDFFDFSRKATPRLTTGGTGRETTAKCGT
jgi:hypothetical protein